MTHYVITANLLTSGDSVYLKAPREWAVSLRDAQVFEKAAADEMLEAVCQQSEELVVVAPYVMDVDVEGGVAVPLSQRERIRAKGPTVHPQFARD